MLTDISRGETNASMRLENIGSGGKEAPKDNVMLFGHGTLYQTSKEASKRAKYKEVIVDHVYSSKQYTRAQPLFTHTFKFYTDSKGNFESTKDLPTDYFEHSLKPLRVESTLFSKFLKKAVALQDPKLWGSIVGQVEAVARGSATGHDPVETVAEDDGIRQFEIRNRTLLATNDQVRKDIKESIEGALQKVKSSGNPITALNATTKHSLDQCIELEYWSSTSTGLRQHSR